MLQRGAILSGKYRVDRVLGEGGMAVVYAVTHLRNTARLAIKVLNPGSASKEHVRARFVREGKVANSVNHPGAVQMIDDGVAEDGSPYLVMEHLNGVCVDDLGLRSVSLGAALNIAYQVLDVLRAAHENGIIHRDIKPANLFVLRDGRVKVLDFGISRLHDGGEPFDSAATGSVMGTPFFMAPEQARAETREIDTRTDVFAVGATLFRLISGQFLYTGEQSRQVMLQAATQQARSLAAVAPGTPQAVLELVAKAVACDRGARWQSAQAMQDAVRLVHEALFGAIGFEPLATLVSVHEFRRKSHSKLTSRASGRPGGSSSLDASPLSTTLPAVAAETRSRESFGSARDPAANRAGSSLPPSEAPELAGWTGQVPPEASQKPKTAVNRRAQPLARSLANARVVRFGALAAAIGVAILGLAHRQTPPRATAMPAANPEVQVQALVPRAEPAAQSTSAAALETPASTEPAPRTLPRAPRTAPPPPKALSAPRPAVPLTPRAQSRSVPAPRVTVSVAQMNIDPSLIPIDDFGR